MDEECIFCMIIKNRTELLYEDDFCVAMLDKFPISKGHCLIISKEHAKDLTYASDKTLQAMAIALKKMLKKIDAKLSPTGLKVVSNIRAPAGQYVMHLHFHIIPVYHGTYNPGENTEREGVEILEHDKIELLKLLKTKK